MPKSFNPLRYPPHYEHLLRRAVDSATPVVIDFATKEKAAAFRFDFYAWVKAHQRQADNNQSSQEIANIAMGMVLSFQAPSSIKISNRMTSEFAQILEAQGFIPELPKLPTFDLGIEIPIETSATGASAPVPGSHSPTTLHISPLTAFEQTMTKLGYTGASEKTNNLAPPPTKTEE